MLDERDRQLMLCEKIMEMDMDDLGDLLTRLTGNDSPETIEISDPQGLKSWLRYLTYVLGMRVKIPVSEPEQPTNNKAQ